MFRGVGWIWWEIWFERLDLRYFLSMISGFYGCFNGCFNGCDGDSWVISRDFQGSYGYVGGILWGSCWIWLVFAVICGSVWKLYRGLWLNEGWRHHIVPRIGSENGRLHHKNGTYETTVYPPLQELVMNYLQTLLFFSSICWSLLTLTHVSKHLRYCLQWVKWLAKIGLGTHGLIPKGYWETKPTTNGHMWLLWFAQILVV